MSSRFISRRRYLTGPGFWRDGAAMLTSQDSKACDRFAAALAQYHHASGAVLFSSGRSALIHLLRAAGVPAGSEILVPALGLAALVKLLRENGYRPVAVDIDPQTLQMTAQDAAKRVGPRSRVILLTHMFGRAAAPEPFRQLARDNNLLLVEDCAQSQGSRWKNHPVGTFGDAAILSFDLLKLVNTLGGGAVLCRDPGLIERLSASQPASMPPWRQRARRYFGALAEHFVLTRPTLARAAALALAHPALGERVANHYRRMQDHVRPGDFRFCPAQAQLGLRQLAALDGRIAWRREMARQLSSLLESAGDSHANLNGNGYFFLVRARDAKALRRHLLEQGIDCGTGSEVADLCVEDGQQADYPAACTAFAELVQLPLHEGLEDEDLERIARGCRGRLRVSERIPARAV